MIKLVVFDMAGTTVYDGDAVAQCFQAAIATKGVMVERSAVNAVMGVRKPDAIRSLLQQANKPADDATVHAIHDDFVARMIRFYSSDPAVREVPGSAAVLAQLRAAGIKIGINSGFSRPIVDAIIQRLDWLPKIDISVSSDEVPQGRPHPDMIRVMMDRLAISDPSSIAKVGDTTVDMHEGKNAGCRYIIGVLTGANTREELQACPHTHIVDSVLNVPAIVLG